MKKRIVRLCLWGGFALFLVGSSSCGVGFLSVFDYTNQEAQEFGANAMNFGVWSVILSIGMIIVGSSIKAISKNT